MKKNRKATPEGIRLYEHLAEIPLEEIEQIKHLTKGVSYRFPDEQSLIDDAEERARKLGFSFSRYVVSLITLDLLHRVLQVHGKVINTKPKNKKGQQ